jgi:hypothetical protein
MVIIETASTESTPIISFRILFLLINRCQWVVDAHRAGALTLAAELLVLVRYRLADVDRRQQHEDVCLDKRNAHVQ